MFRCSPRFTARMFVLLGFMLIFFSSIPLTAAQDEWSLDNNSNNIQVYTRSVPGSNIKEVKAATEINATPEKVFALLLDSDKFVEFMPYIDEARTVARESPDVWYLYQRIPPPLISERDYTLRHQKLVDTQRGHYELRWDAANDHGPTAKVGVVRVELCTGSYILDGLDGGTRTRITYQLHTDPGGSLPKWIVNFANSTSVPNLLRAIVNRVANPNYHR